MFERNSPSVRIQSYFRGYRVRNKAFFSANDRVRAALKIQRVYRGWAQRKINKALLMQFLKETGQVELLYTQEQYRRYKANRMLLRVVQKFIAKSRRAKLHQRSALKIQTFWRSKNIKHKWYKEILGINEERKIYFLKEQRIDLHKIFRIVLEKYPEVKKQYSFEKLK